MQPSIERTPVRADIIRFQAHDEVKMLLRIKELAEELISGSDKHVCDMTRRIGCQGTLEIIEDRERFRSFVHDAGNWHLDECIDAIMAIAVAISFGRRKTA